MEIAIYHSNFYTDAGGAEIAVMKATYALQEAGHRVDVYAGFAAADVMRAVCENVSLCPSLKVVGPDPNEVYLKMADLLSRKRIFVSLWWATAFKHVTDELLSKIGNLSSEYDLVIGDQSPLDFPLGIHLDSIPGDLIYVHYPSALLDLRILNNYVDNIPDDAILKLYKRLVSAIRHKILARWVCGVAKTFKIIVNSTWTRTRLVDLNIPLITVASEPCGRELATKLVGASVVNAPVEYELYSSMYDPDRKKDFVLTVSRYSPGKNLWSLIYVASKVTDAHFVIAGSTKTASSDKVIGQLEALIDKLRVKNVTLERDVPRRRLVELYEEAKVYLHPLHSEPFGIAIAEGAAAGAVPVVFRDGGGWTDIASRIDPMLGYNNIGEAASIVRSLLGNEGLWLRLSRRSVEVARDFSWGSYKRRLDAAVREAYELKRRTNK